MKFAMSWITLSKLFRELRHAKTTKLIKQPRKWYVAQCVGQVADNFLNPSFIIGGPDIFG
jgi:hypothetical protein